jgi:hypothetical protein
MKKFSYLIVLVFGGLVVQAQEKQSEPVEIESLKDAECLKAILGMEGYLYKTGLNQPNTPENFYYAIDTKGVEEEYPYLIVETEKGKEIKYERMMPILIEALEESVERLEVETENRVRLEEEFVNYQVTVENHLIQMQYQIDLLKSELSGIYETKSVE